MWCPGKCGVLLHQVEEVVETGALDPEAIHLPSIYVDRVVIGNKFEKRIEVSGMA